MARAPFKFVIYRDLGAKREWRWRLVSRNGNIVANCGEGYRHRADALRIVAAIREGKTWDAPVVEDAPAPAAKRTSRGPAAKQASLSPATKRTARRP